MSLVKKGREILKGKAVIMAPDFDEANYDFSFTRALTYYNNNVSTEKLKDLSIDYWDEQGKNTTGFAKMNASKFQQVGILVHLIKRGIKLTDQHKEYIENKFVSLAYVPEKGKEVKEVKPKKEIDLITGEFEGYLDDLFCGKDVSAPDALIAKHEVTNTQCKKIKEVFTKHLEEFNLVIAGKDKDLVEGYSHIKKRELKKIVEWITNLISACSNKAVASKPRSKKVVLPSKLVSKLKYQREFQELGLKSFDPAKIVGCSELWVYDTEKRKLYKIVSTKDTLTVSGTTIQNYDAVLSGSKIVRKPEETLKDIQKLHKKQTNDVFNKQIKTAMSKFSGRFNENMILLNWF